MAAALISSKYQGKRFGPAPSPPFEDRKKKCFSLKSFRVINEKVSNSCIQHINNNKKGRLALLFSIKKKTDYVFRLAV